MDTVVWRVNRQASCMIRGSGLWAGDEKMNPEALNNRPLGNTAKVPEDREPETNKNNPHSTVMCPCHLTCAFYAIKSQTFMVKQQQPTNSKEACM